MQNAKPAPKRVSKISENTVDYEAEGECDNEEINPLDSDAQTADRDTNQSWNYPSKRHT